MVNPDMPGQQESRKRNTFLRRSVDFIGRWTWRFAGTFLILGALFVLAAQTQTFRNWLRNVVLDVANDELLGKLSIDDARLDIFHGIVLIHPKLYADGTLVFEANELSVSYDIAAIANS